MSNNTFKMNVNINVVDERVMASFSNTDGDQFLHRQ